MPGYLDVDPSGVTFTESDWKEVLRTFAPGEDVFSSENGSASLTGHIPWDCRASFIRYCLPFSWTEGYSLRRNNPRYHPWYDWLMADSITLKPYGSKANENEPHGGIKYDLNDSTYQFATTIYSECEATITFRQQPFFHIADVDIDSGEYQEWDRYFYDISHEGSLQTFDITSGMTFTFAEGPVAGRQFPCQLVFNKLESTIIFRWMYVPHEYLFGLNPLGGYSYVMKKFMNVIGRVNSTPFLGYDPHELLMHPPRLQRFLWPVRPADSRSAPWGYHVDVVMTAFKPERGVTSPSSPYRGYDLMPWSGQGEFRNDLFGKWYGATKDGTVSGRRYLQEADFTNVFTHADKP